MGAFEYKALDKSGREKKGVWIDPSAPLVGHGSNRPVTRSNDAQPMGPRNGDAVSLDSLGPVVTNHRRDGDAMGSGVEGPSDPTFEELESIDWESALVELAELLPPTETDAPCLDDNDGIPPVTVALPDSSTLTDAAAGTASSGDKPIDPVRKPHSASKRIQASYMVATRSARSSRPADAIPTAHAIETYVNPSTGYVDPATRLRSIRQEIDCWESVVMDVREDEFLDVSFADAGARVWAETAYGYTPHGSKLVRTARPSQQGAVEEKTLDGSRPRTTMSMTVDSENERRHSAGATQQDKASTSDRVKNTRNKHRSPDTSGAARPYGEHSERKSKDQSRGEHVTATPSPSPEMSVHDLMRFFSISSNEMRCRNASELQQLLHQSSTQSSEADLPSAIRASDTVDSSKIKATRSRRNRSRRDETTPRRYRIGRRSHDRTVKPVRD